MPLEIEFFIFSQSHCIPPWWSRGVLQYSQITRIRSHSNLVCPLVWQERVSPQMKVRPPGKFKFQMLNCAALLKNIWWTVLFHSRKAVRQCICWPLGNSAMELSSLSPTKDTLILIMSGRYEDTVKNQEYLWQIQGFYDKLSICCMFVC